MKDLKAEMYQMKQKQTRNSLNITKQGLRVRFRVRVMGRSPGVAVTPPPPPFGRLFIVLNEQHAIFRWRKGANLKNFQYFCPKNHS